MHRKHTISTQSYFNNKTVKNPITFLRFLAFHQQGVNTFIAIISDVNHKKIRKKKKNSNFSFCSIDFDRLWGIRLSKGQARPNNHPLTKVHIPSISESQIQVLTDTIRPPQNTCPCIGIQAERKHASTPVERSRHWYLSFILGGEVAPIFFIRRCCAVPDKTVPCFSVWFSFLGGGGGGYPWTSSRECAHVWW